MFEPFIPKNISIADPVTPCFDAVDQADMRVLLMSLIHLTGDPTWLQEPFLPQRDSRLIPDPGAGLNDEAQQRIKNAAKEWMSKGMPSPQLRDPGNSLLQRMMSVSLGEAVPSEYSQMMREEMGFVSRAPSQCSFPEAEKKDFSVVIVGAGVCGIALAVQLTKLEIPFTILERSHAIGGVWYKNRYPGCGVDTPNHSYSYSFGSRYLWSRYFSPREEILDYLNKIVEEYKLEPNIRFGTQVDGAYWDEQSCNWHISAHTGGAKETLTSRFFISAIGQLSHPSIPDLKGKEKFEGISFHSMNWPENLDIAGKKVAVIGTGATAMQLVPSIANTAGQVHVYQRSPQWVRPIEGYADPINPGAQWLLEHMPYYAEWFRFNMFWRYGDGLLACLRKDPSWDYPERSVNKINDKHRIEMTDFIHSKLLSRPDLMDKCLPHYPPYGKRILLDNQWYETLLKSNVHLVTERIDQITENGVLSSEGELREADIVVYATGFKLTEMAARLNIQGVNGIRLADVWADDDPKAYLGMAISGFPNFFTMLGPNSGPAHGGSVIFQAECQVRYITSCIVSMLKKEIKMIDVKSEVVQEHVSKVDAEHETLVWTHPSVSTYYRNSKGRVFSVMPWRFVDYWSMTHDPDLSQYNVTYQEHKEGSGIGAI
ncbi:MAG: NAD(P)/FAD-dependent oxidoreductase [Burkholderiaceae bacterium]|nr:NAD(P)/FAD-dependent oxidoreductase [Burkholderiaceae bacterium]